MSRNRIIGPSGALMVDDGGQGGAPVVLVHSLAGTSTHWARQLEHLRQSRRAVAFDLRGHGASDPPRNQDCSISGFAGDIAAVVDSLGFTKFFLVGHSLGGGVALSYAGTYPRRVAGLFLLDPIGDGKQIAGEQADSFLQQLNSDFENVIQGYWSQIAGPNTRVRERLLSDLKATPRETVTRGFAEVLRFDPDPALAAYSGPRLAVVTPNNDQPFSLHRLGQGFPHRMVTGTGHWIQLDRPELVNQLLDEFLEKSVSGKGTA
jgi:pimeloyl-ACP methyl ester carboxylesterase